MCWSYCLEMQCVKTGYPCWGTHYPGTMSILLLFRYLCWTLLPLLRILLLILCLPAVYFHYFQICGWTITLLNDSLGSECRRPLFNQTPWTHQCQTRCRCRCVALSSRGWERILLHDSWPNQNPTRERTKHNINNGTLHKMIKQTTPTTTPKITVC